MATSSFTKNFVVSPEGFDECMDKMDNTPVIKVRGFKSQLVEFKDFNNLISALDKKYRDSKVDL